MNTTVVNLSNLDGSNGFRMEGRAANDLLGGSISGAGDVNGDGFDDVIIGAIGADPNGDYSGSSYVVFGKADGFGAAIDLSNLNGNNGFRLDGVNYLDFSSGGGSSGDVNGDGFDDLSISAASADPNGLYNAGSNYVVFGKASGFAATLDLSSLNGSNGFRMDGVAANDSVGGVGNAGDVNGDGFDDLIMGAPSTGLKGHYTGSSYVVFGKAWGFAATLNLSDLDGSNGFRMDGVTAEDQLGASVSKAGDVNGDGFDDFIVGAHGADPNGRYSGSSYIVFGKASGFSATLDLSDLNGSNGFRLDGTAELDQSGLGVSNAGDMNGDGFDDVLVSVFRAAHSDDRSGSSYVIFGKASGFKATMDLSSLNGSNGFRIDGASAFDFAGVSASSAGDVNNDGFDDVIVGAPGADSNGDSSGSSYVIFGKASGFNATLNLSNLGNNGFRLDGALAGDESGRAVSSAGDVNNDGFADLLIGAPFADPNGGRSGSSYIVFGRSDFDGGIPEIVGTSGDDQLKGTSAAEHFKAAGGDDLMIGRGGADEFDGGAGNDKMNVADLNFASVDGGSGTDVLHTDGKDLNLDLTDYLDKIKGIETICLYGRGDNTLTLTGEELKDLSDTTNTLKIHGNDGDRVLLEGNWVDNGSHGYYHTFTQDEAVLLVGMHVTAVVS